MKRTYNEEKDIKSKKRRLMYGPVNGPASTSTQPGTLDFMASCDSDATTTRAQVTAGASVSVQIHLSHLYVLVYCYRADRP